MPYTVSISESKRFIRIVVRVEMSRKVAAEIASEAVPMAKKLGIENFLYDVREAPNVETVLSNYEWAYKDMAAVEADRRARRALLVHPDDHSHDFVETVARNAGYNMRIFHDEEKAVAWLEDNEPPA